MMGWGCVHDALIVWEHTRRWSSHAPCSDWHACSQYPYSQLPAKTRLQNDLLSVEWDVKRCSFGQRRCLVGTAVKHMALARRQHARCVIYELLMLLLLLLYDISWLRWEACWHHAVYCSHARVSCRNCLGRCNWCHSAQSQLIMDHSHWLMNDRNPCT